MASDEKTERRYPFDPDNPVPKGITLAPKDLRSKYYKVFLPSCPSWATAVRRTVVRRLTSVDTEPALPIGGNRKTCPTILLNPFVTSQVIDPESKFFAGDPRLQRDRRRERDPKRTNHYKKIRCDPQEVWE